MRTRHYKVSLTVLTALLVLLIAGLAGGSLWLLRKTHNQSVRDDAAQRVLQQGRLMTAHLALQLARMESKSESRGWEELSRQVWSLHAIEDGLQYISVSEDGVTIFLEHTRHLETQSPRPEAVAVYAGARDVEMGRKIIKLGGESVPVVVFSKTFTPKGGSPCTVEVAVRKDTVEREVSPPAAAISRMFRLSLLTVLVSFGFCALLVVWMMRREEAREAQRREEEHLAFAGVLANSIVHDFRNPMSSLGLDVQMLEKETAESGRRRMARIHELAGRIGATLKRMDKVFEEFFYLSRPESETMKPTNLQACLNDCATLLAPRFDQRGVALLVEGETKPLRVQAYPSSLRRALTNVITNAEQSSPEEGSVVVRCARDGRMAVVSVLDRGPGVDDSEKQAIFDMFYSGRPGGTGLGLFLARTAIDRCRGSIEVRDRSGGGAEFRIVLPLAPEREGGQK